MPTLNHHHPLQHGLVRIFYNDDPRKNLSCGTGVLVDDNTILTCAHVVCDALNLSRDSKEIPSQTVRLDLPLLSHTNLLSARIIFWDIDMDLAGMQLMTDLPDKATPIILTIPDELWGHKVQTFGFPKGHKIGAWSEYRLRGPVASKWIEMIDPLTTGNFIQQGFSGSPVWDDTAHCCVGIVVAVDRDDKKRVGYLIPTSEIIEKWKGIPFKKTNKTHFKRDLPLLVPYLVDRYEQENDLRQLYKKSRETDPKPIVVIIHGDENQAHDMFIRRVAEEYIPKLSGVDGPVIRHPIPWPGNIKQAEELSLRLQREVADVVLHDPDATLDNIQHALANHKFPITFEIELLTSDWTKHKEKIIKTALEFWNDWPTLSSRQNLFVLIYITHKMPKNNLIKRGAYRLRKRQVFDRLSKCNFEQYEKIIGAVLSELVDISHPDVKSWVRTTLQDYFDGDISQLQLDISNLFERTERLPMGFLAIELRRILNTNFYM